MLKPINSEKDLGRLNAILKRSQFEEADINETVANVLKRVRDEGDSALYDFTARFDGVALQSLKVDPKTVKDAYDRLSEELLTALKNARTNIERFHRAQKDESYTLKNEGASVGQRVTPLSTVGIYIPGGTAAYPSTVLMNAIPASIAGVGKIVMVTPPGKDGRVKPAILVAADLAGVDEIYTIGGAQAVAALTYGTKSVPKVDKITGPGNMYVAVAKRMVSGYVGIDMVAGPSEITIIADETSDPAQVAADMFSQAEHDVYASSVALINDEATAEKVSLEIARQLENAPRKDTIEASLRDYGAIITTPSVEHSIELANAIAPEHLEILTKDPETVSEKILNAGAIFIGPYSPEPIGDYYAGPNHTLPTSGTARFMSALSTRDFQKQTSVIHYSKEAFMNAADDVIRLAEEEGLYAHAEAIRLRKEGS